MEEEEEKDWGGKMDEEVKGVKGAFSGKYRLERGRGAAESN